MRDPQTTLDSRKDAGSVPTVLYSTDLGESYHGQAEALVAGDLAMRLQGKVQLVFTSPPFPLNRKKRYSNLQGDAYLDWLANFAAPLARLLTPDGSIVIEMGNAWEPGTPTMSTLAMEALLRFKRAANLHLCQEFIWHNPAKLPTPAQWVTIERIRVKDSFTRLWWMSPVPKPKADNRRVLVPYSASMRTLLRRKKYNSGRRPSEHVIGAESFLVDHGGAIPPNVINSQRAGSVAESVLVGANTANDRAYTAFCAANGTKPHPARMPVDLAEFFISLCTTPGDLVLDPFGGSNVTGSVAENLQRRWIAIEANAEYAATGAGRFESVCWRTQPCIGAGFIQHQSPPEKPRT